MLDLKTLQRQFKSAVRYGSDDGLATIRQANGHSPERRLQVYRRAIRARLAMTVTDDFPLLVDHLGSEQLAVWVDQYVETCPSTVDNILEYSGGFPPFLAGRVDLYTSELARFEWEQELSIYSDQEPASMGSLAEIDPDSILTCRFVISPEVRLFTSPVQVPEGTELRPVHLIIQAGDWNEITENQFRTLKLLAAGKCVQEVLAEAPDTHPQTIQSQFADWVEQKIIIGFKETT